MERWPNQRRAFDGVLDAVDRGVKRLCITSPTGSGKSLCMTDIIEWASGQGCPVALYTNRRMLYDQTCRVLDAAGIQYGRRASGHDPALLRDVQLCMWQTEASKVYRSQQRDLHAASIVLVDESHQGRGERFRQILADHVAAGATIIGYTATPLDLVDYDELLVAGTPSECREVGALVPANTFAPDEPDLRHVKRYKVGEDLTDAENRKAIMRPGVFGRVLTAWRQHNPQQCPTLLFGPDVKGSLYFAEQFHKAGVSAAHIDGEDVWINGEFHASEPEVREQVAAGSKSGEIKVVCNRFVLREGIDWPWIGCGVSACVFGSLTSYLQSGGRLLRACPSMGKLEAIVLDHGGNWHRHGSLNEDRAWTLGLTNARAVGERQEALREKRAAEPIVCPKCGKVRAAGRTCPACGHESHVKSRAVVQIDGTLRPVEGDIYKPRRTRLVHDTKRKWERMYHRMRRAGRTFRQAEALFFVEEHYWPPRSLPLMPRESADWWRSVADVPQDHLIPRESENAFVH